MGSRPTLIWGKALLKEPELWIGIEEVSCLKVIGSHIEIYQTSHDIT